ncbi:N-acetylmuramoyl-L-alanine amidase [Paenibacillus sp. UNCCL117]|uniref:N-acetylmuramoyl-L-alanine amidase n=1 Tax=Paenibacillus sp. cl123 TaxID=1761875 RepID=UPI0008898C8D|nr:N-acetylmuramoyl-L-alanine amidase [Paenibacillus sp. cl123]SFW41427.1 N-acetylmuramoyl-L-alanine amidase [Paenibacillus sp. UNCCL117]
MKTKWLGAALAALCLWAAPGQALAATVVVDAGHGGSDPGAIGVNGLQEKVVNLDISRKVRDLLMERGYDVRMSRDSDIYLSLSERVAYAKAQQADLFVSIHANSYSNPSTRGAMVLYYDDAYPQASYPASEEMRALSSESRELAQRVLDGFLASAGGTNRGLVPSAVYVVRMGNIPSILVETAFLSNAEDAAMLSTDSARNLMAVGIADGIEAYMPAAADGFADIRSHWAREAIIRLKEQGIVDGSPGGRFEPARALTRAEWVTLLGRVFDLGSANSACPAGSGSVSGSVYEDCKPSSAAANGNRTGGISSGTSSAVPRGGSSSKSPAAVQGAADFRDVTAKHWAFSQLDQAVKTGLLEGYPDGTLRPNQTVSRAEVAVLFERLAQLPTAGTDTGPFRDTPAGHWAAPAIAALKKSGLIDGATATSFAPDKSMTRAEAATLLDRYMRSGSR